jgi:GntR family transcriptional regulator
MLPAPHIDPADPLPIYAQLERAIRSAIASGSIVAGEQLPTVRQLAVDLRVNANTVAKVYADLERDGALETRRGVGTFVADARRPEPRTARERRRGVAAYADEVLDGAHRRAIDAQELIDQLQSRISKGM